MSRNTKAWLPAFAWMAVIFTMSTDLGSGAHTSRFIVPLLRFLVPGISPAGLDAAHFLIRKAGHLTEYAILGLLLLRAVRRTWFAAEARLTWRAAGLALLLAAAYAASDEFHQSFVPSRGPSPVDVMIDTSGAGLGLLLAWLAERWHRPTPRPAADATQ